MNNPEVKSNSEKYQEWLNQLEINVKKLVDDSKENDVGAKENIEHLNKSMDNSFYHGLLDYFLDNADSFDQLKSILLTGLNNAMKEINGADNVDENSKNFVENFLQTQIQLVNNLKIDPNNFNRENAHKALDDVLKERKSLGLSTEKNDKKPEIPKLSLTGELKGIKPGEEGNEQKNSEGLYDELTRNPIEGDNIDDKKNLNKTINTINDEIGSLNRLLLDDKLSNDQNLSNLKDILQNIKDVIYNTTPENVKKLQEFIYKNLNDTDDKNSFDSESRMKGNGFDGKFGDGTLEGLNIILKKIGVFINSLENYINEYKKNEEDEVVDSNLEKVTAKEGLTIKKGDVFTDIYKPENLVENLPNGATVTFIDDHIDTNTLGDITVKVNVSLGETNKEIVVTVKVINDEEDKDSKKDVSTGDTNAPLQLGDGVQQQTYLVMQNCPINPLYYPELSEATFYSTQPCENGENFLGDGQPRFTETTSEFLGEREYYLKLDKYPNKLYKVKVDSCGCICPIATEIFCNLKNRNGSPVERKVLLANNESCKQYLRNKLFNGINAEIGWNEKLQDYTISSYGKTLTIEPMTLDNNWICDNLSQSLALLNFTNYLRGAGKIDGIKFINDNPDLKHDENFYVRVKRQDHPEGKRRYPIDSQKFCLCNINKDKIRNYIRYNNHEDWEDDWDKKRKNKGYTKVQL